MLEVLVALLVLMLGMLAVAGLQSLSISGNHSAYLRSQAIIQAHDMSDRMHANSAGVQEGSYNSISGISDNPPTCLSTSTSADVLAGVECTTAQMAQFDAWEWNTTNALVLPSGLGQVQGPDGSGIYTITVSWLENEESGSSRKTFDFKVKPLP